MMHERTPTPLEAQGTDKPGDTARRRSAVRPWNRNEAEEESRVRENAPGYVRGTGRPFDPRAFDARLGYVRLSARQDDLYRVVLGDIVEFGENEGDAELSGSEWVRQCCRDAAEAWTARGERHRFIGADGKTAAWEPVAHKGGPQLWQTAVDSNDRFRWLEIAAEQNLRGLATWVRQSTDYAAIGWLLAHPRPAKEMQALLPLNVPA